ALARTLQKQGLETKDDPAAQFVLLRESRDLAVAAGDASTAVESIELLAGTFRVDPARLKAAALTQISQDAKSPDLSKASAEALLRLGEDPSLADDVEGREKLSAAALSAARKSKDVPLAARCELRAKEIAELKSRLSRIKAAESFSR